MSRPNRSEKQRTPLGARNTLTFSDMEPGYSYRVINDVDDRLTRAEAAGYEFVEAKKGLGDVRAAEATKMGSKVSKPVGGGKVGYLMRIKEEWYQEDQAEKARKISESEATMKASAAKGEYGPGLTND